MNDFDSWLSQWQSVWAADGLRGPRGEPSSGADLTTGPAGLQAAAAAFARFAAEFSRLRPAAFAAANPSERARLEAEVAALAQRCFAGAVPPWPALPGQGAEWGAALQSGSTVLAEIAAATGAAFAARLAGPAAPRTLRATFDAWIDCAERAFHSAAHSESFARAQAVLLNEFVRVRLRQQALVEQASRLAGLPTRREVDGLHDSVRELKAELARQQAPAATKPKPPRRKSRR